MARLDFPRVAELRYQDSIVVNGKILLRNKTQTTFDEQNSTLTYSFYEVGSWNYDKKGCVPWTTHELSMKVEFENQPGREWPELDWRNRRVMNYFGGTLINKLSGNMEEVRELVQ